MSEGNHNTEETIERATLTNRFITAWVNFCVSTATQQSNEESFQAWFASCLIELFGLERVYREIHLSEDEIKRCFADPGLEALFPQAHDKLVMGRNCLQAECGVMS
jgi:hypothetical protein